MRKEEKDFCRLAERLMQHPTAPYHEQEVMREVVGFCREQGLACTPDRFGNLLVRLENDRSLRPMALAAHMDHPGFEVLGQETARQVRVRFWGSVAEAYFKKGTGVRLFPGDLRGRLQKRLAEPKEYLVQLEESVIQPPRFGVWDLPRFALHRGRIYGCGCDDLVGVATVLFTLAACRKEPVNLLGVLSRAEEVGFQGALQVADQGLIPPKALVVSLETSKEVPPVTMGRGVILRAGDKTSVFNSAATRYLVDIAQGLAGSRRGFQFQKALMTGGTCEATAYQEFGYQTAAVCIALGNYHNCGTREKIREEFVDVRDAVGMSHLLQAAAREMGSFDQRAGRLKEELQRLLRIGSERLAPVREQG